jgi:hypothetical protein
MIAFGQARRQMQKEPIAIAPGEQRRGLNRAQRRAIEHLQRKQRVA